MLSRRPSRCPNWVRLLDDTYLVSAVGSITFTFRGSVQGEMEKGVYVPSTILHRICQGVYTVHSAN